LCDFRVWMRSASSNGSPSLGDVETAEKPDGDGTGWRSVAVNIPGVCYELHRAVFARTLRERRGVGGGHADEQSLAARQVTVKRPGLVGSCEVRKNVIAEP